MATNVIQERVEAAHHEKLNAEDINPIPRFFTGLNFLNLIQSEPLSELATSALAAYQEVFSEKPWEEVELKDIPFNEAKPIIIERLKRQLSNQNSLMILLLNPLNINEVMGFANAQLLDKINGIEDMEAGMIKYYDKDKITTIHRHPIAVTSNTELSEKIFVVEEFGIPKRFRGGPKMLIKLTNALTQGMRSLDPSMTIDKCLMWTSDNSKMNALAESTRMTEVMETTGFRKGKGVRLICYQFSVKQLENLSEGYVPFILGLIKIALIEKAKGNPQPLSRLLAQLSGKDKKKINHES